MALKTGTRRLKMKIETRRIILDSAYRLFEEKGYEKTTMRELAARAEVGLGTIFQHFPDKGSLLAAAFEADVGAAADDAFRSLPDVGLKDRLMHIVRRLYDYYAMRPLLSRELVRQVTFPGGETGGDIQASWAAFMGKIVGLVDEARGSGEIRAEVISGDAALAFWSYYFSGLLAGLHLPDSNFEAAADMVDILLDQLMTGIGSRPAEGGPEQF